MSHDRLHCVIHMLECPVCWESYPLSRMAVPSCYHTVCHTCASKLQRTVPLRCPVCRGPFEDRVTALEVEVAELREEVARLKRTQTTLATSQPVDTRSPPPEAEKTTVFGSSLLHRMYVTYGIIPDTRVPSKIDARRERSEVRRSVAFRAGCC